MFKIFKKRKDKPSVMYSVFQKAGEVVDSKQKQLCNHLNKKAEKFTVRQLKIGFFIFCFTYLAGIALVMLKVFDYGGSTIHVQSIRVPKQVLPQPLPDSTIINFEQPLKAK